MQDELQVATVSALVRAEGITHYTPRDNIHELRVRLIQVRDILGQVIDWHSGEDQTPTEETAPIINPKRRMFNALADGEE